MTEATVTEAALPLKPTSILTPVAHSWVTTHNRIGIRLEEAAAKIENTTLYITVEGVEDLYGNEAEAVGWTAFVNTSRLLSSDRNRDITKPYFDETEFEASIMNTSGNPETWTVTGLPTWLTASKTQGTLLALSD